MAAARASPAAQVSDSPSSSTPLQGTKRAWMSIASRAPEPPSPPASRQAARFPPNPPSPPPPPPEALPARLAPRRLLVPFGWVPPPRICRARVQRGEKLVGAHALAFAHLLVGSAVLVEPVERLVAFLAHQLVKAHRLRAAANAYVVDLAHPREFVLDRLVGVLAHQDVRAVGLVERLDARRHVHGVADHRVVEAARRAHSPDEHH